MADGTPVRIVGFNTPEKFVPICAQEAKLGNRASDRLRQLVASGTSTVTRVAYACAPGPKGPTGVTLAEAAVSSASMGRMSPKP